MASILLASASQRRNLWLSVLLDGSDCEVESRALSSPEPEPPGGLGVGQQTAVSYTHLRAHETEAESRMPSSA